MTTFSDIAGRLAEQAIELPSWAFGNSGTRFKVFSTQGTPRTVEEKLADAAAVHRLTGLAPSVALHIPWDRVDDYDKLARFADDLGVRLGTINSNTFQDDDYKFGSLTHVDERIRAKAVAHQVECIDVMDVTGSRDLKIWLPDGTNYPGQGDLRDRQDRLADSLAQVYARLSGEQRLVLEYKFFEPAFYANDDLIVGAADPFQLFRILHEVIRGGGYGQDSDVAFMLDQCHNVEAKIPGQIRSVLNVQEMTARALLVDRDALREAERSGDVLAGNAVLMDAFYTDVRADLADWRAGRGLPADPMKAYAASGYQDQIVAERVGGTQAGWGA